mmetsp:Transcript_28458/g.72925  ORF Transcript_28458/g.72925 Transcript_28458/m.72925 type:complete len:282 (+) Transcript_28458:261-1106(+)
MPPQSVARPFPLPRTAAPLPSAELATPWMLLVVLLPLLRSAWPTPPAGVTPSIVDVVTICGLGAVDADADAVSAGPACKPKKEAIICCAASAPSGDPSRKESATRLAVASTSGSDRKALIMLISKLAAGTSPDADGRSARVDAPGADAADAADATDAAEARTAAEAAAEAVRAPPLAPLDGVCCCIRLLVASSGPYASEAIANSGPALWSAREYSSQASGHRPSRSSTNPRCACALARTTPSDASAIAVSASSSALTGPLPVGWVTRYARARRLCRSASKS